MVGSIGSEWSSVITAVVALVGAVIALLQYTNWKTSQGRKAEVAGALRETVDGLASDNEVMRLAAAIRLRRFFDPTSEIGKAGASHVGDVVAVMAGVLRELPTSHFQKLLADGLRSAPSLEQADLQGTNLQGAYLAGVHAAKADLFRADLTRCSLKRASAKGAVFVEVNAASTVFDGADLQEVDFRGADLSGASFDGAKLDGAKFAGARGIPHVVAARLDADGVVARPALEGTEGPRGERRAVRAFISRPAVVSGAQASLLLAIEDAVVAAGAEVVRLDRHGYTQVGVLAALRREIASCDAVVVVGLRQLDIERGRWRAGSPEEVPKDGAGLPTPWNQVEAGIAAGSGVPMFVVREAGVEGGVFDLPTEASLVVADLQAALDRRAAGDSLYGWIRRLEPGPPDAAQLGGDGIEG